MIRKDQPDNEASLTSTVKCLTKRQEPICKLEFTPISLQKEGDVFRIGINMLFDCRNVSEDASRMFVPVLCDGDHHLELPLVLVTGRRRYRALRWALWGIRGNILRNYRIRKILKAGRDEFISYPYRMDIGYQDWMEKADISFG